MKKYWQVKLLERDTYGNVINGWEYTDAKTKQEAIKDARKLKKEVKEHKYDNRCGMDCTLVVEIGSYSDEDSTQLTGEIF